MHIVSLCCALAFAAGVPALLLVQDGGLAAKVTMVAAKKPATSKKKVVKPTGPPAKDLFGAAKTPALLQARSIGFYAKGCLAGAKSLPIDGSAWQVMRTSRNRNWGHPSLIALLEKLAVDAHKDGWPGLLVGDISQPRGGPMSSGHASHQVGLDADIWLTPMPNKRLTKQEREDLSATSMLAEDKVSIDPKVWTDAHIRLLKLAASYATVERIFVHPAIKKSLCEATAQDSDRDWLHKVRPYWGHNDHFHVRLTCPSDSAGCEAQPPLPKDDGCGKDLIRWLALVKPKPEPPKQTTPALPATPRPAMTLDQLPVECRAVLANNPGGVPIPASAVAALKATAPADAPADKSRAETK